MPPFQNILELNILVKVTGTVKRNLISSIRNLVHELPHELPNDLRRMILKNLKMLEKYQIRPVPDFHSRN